MPDVLLTFMDKLLVLGFFLLQCVLLSLFWQTTVSAFESVDKSSLNTAITFANTTNKGSEFQLEARETPLADVLETLTRKTNTPIHYSVLPEGLVTATCVGPSLKAVLECLLNRKADIIVRYGEEKSGTTGKPSGIVEAWILGAKLETADNSGDCTASSKTSHEQNAPDKAKAAALLEEQKQTDDLLTKAKSRDPNARAEAVGALLGSGQPGNPAIKAALEQALHDDSPAVRAQAVSTLARRNDTKSGAATAIQEALHDSSTDVRRMAVDAITNDMALLQQAVNDSDEFIRNLAVAKLEELTKHDAK